MMHNYMNKHPHKVVNGHRRPFSCCFTSFGWHCCCKSMRKSDIRGMGVGVSVYFKFLKFMMALFLWFTILSIPAYYLYY
jgi:hypothetical protein